MQISATKWRRDSSVKHFYSLILGFYDGEVQQYSEEFKHISAGCEERLAKLWLEAPILQLDKC